MANSFRELIVYKKAFNLAMVVFELSKKFPPEEKYALTDQMRRSSRSVCRAIGEGYRKRQYPKYFISKMSDADMENSETQILIDFALSCGYIKKRGEYGSKNPIRRSRQAAQSYDRKPRTLSKKK